MLTVRRLGLSGALAGALALGGCMTHTGAMGRGEQTWTLNGSQKTPAAQGKVEVAAKSKDGTRQIEVEVKHLARPSAVFDGTTTYVVWVKPEGGRPENVGALALDKDLKGDLKTKTPYKVFDVMVTAEMSPGTTLPSLNNEVFSTRIYVPA
jgi:hypothetical protein